MFFYLFNYNFVVQFLRGRLNNGRLFVRLLREEPFSPVIAISEQSFNEFTTTCLCAVDLFPHCTATDSLPFRKYLSFWPWRFWSSKTMFFYVFYNFVVQFLRGRLNNGRLFVRLLREESFSPVFAISDQSFNVEQQLHTQWNMFFHHQKMAKNGEKLTKAGIVNILTPWGHSSVFQRKKLQHQKWTWGQHLSITLDHSNNNHASYTGSASRTMS